MKSVVFWIRQTRRQEVELSFEHDALRIHILPFVNSGVTRRNTQASSDDNLLASISFEDIIGCHRMKGRSTEDRSSYFTVYSYPLRGRIDGRMKLDSQYSLSDRNALTGDQNSNSDNNLVKKTGRRERRCYTFQIQGKYVYDDNSAYVRNWVDAIRARIMNVEAPHLQSTTVSKDSQLRQRRLYVLVNPHSGPGRALEIFQEKVMPIFAEANIACRLIVTERANHAHELMRDLNITEWDGIVIVSGDGLVYEVINGLARRSDREQAFKIPIGAIPGGSGNALAAATCFAPRETVKGDFAVDAAVMISKPKYQPMRLIRVEMKGHNIWSFISVGWGLLSDIDIESEKFRRSLGSARFTAGAFLRVLNLRRYRARISYLPADDVPSPSNENAAAVTSSPVNQNGFMRMQSEAARISSSQTNAARSSETGESYGKPKTVQRAKSMSPVGASRDVEQSIGSGLVAATPCTDPTFSPFQVRFDTDSPGPSTSSPSSNGNVVIDREYDIVPMPNLDEPVPSNWKVIEDELVLFYAVYLNHIGAEAPYMPNSRLDDQCIYLTLIRTSTVTRTQLVKFLFAIEHAEHVKMPFFEVIPAKAFRLDRLSVGTSDIVAVDGELIRDVQGPIQACVSNLKATIMTSSK